MTSTTRKLLATASLVVLVPVAIFASSYRYLDIYLPSQPSKQVKTVDGVAHYTSEVFVDGNTVHRDINVRFLGAKPVPEWNGFAPATGGQMWEFTFEFAAAPDVFADGCEMIALDAEGKKYRMRAATQVALDSLAINNQPCVPAEAPGPTVDFYTDKLVDSVLPRPEKWTATLGVTMPQGVNPATVRLLWDTPYYAEFPVAQS